MDRTKSRVAAVALTLSLVACDRDKTEPVSQTTTTSAELEPVDRSGVAVPMGPVVEVSDPEPGATVSDQTKTRTKGTGDPSSAGPHDIGTPH